MGNDNIEKFARKHGYSADFRPNSKNHEWRRKRRADRRAKASRAEWETYAA